MGCCLPNNPTARELSVPSAVCESMERTRRLVRIAGKEPVSVTGASAILERPAGTLNRVVPRLVVSPPPRTFTGEEPRPMAESTVRQVDQQLVERAQRGDKKAFELLVLKYQRKLARLLSRFVRDPAEVEDVTQEAFIKAYRALPSFRGDSAFYTWLYRIGINTAKNYLMAMGRRAPTSTEVEAEEAEGFEEGEQLRDINTPESVLLSNEIAETVNATIEALPEELRKAIQMREIEGMSYEDIAHAMDCPIGTVRSRIFRAREAIAEQLRPLLGTRKDKRW